MKLNHILSQRSRRQVIHRFGGAELVRFSNGEHELIGGTNADRQAAFEWVSLFAHEIVFTHFHRGDDDRRQKKSFIPQLQPAF